MDANNTAIIIMSITILLLIIILLASLYTTGMYVDKYDACVEYAATLMVGP